MGRSLGPRQELESHHSGYLARYKDALTWRIKSKLRALLASFRPVDPTLRPVFVTGVMGSGTTLLTRLLHQLYDLQGVANETAREISVTSPLHIRRSRDYASVEAYLDALTLPAQCSPDGLRTDLLKFYRRVCREDSSSKVVLDKAPNTHMVRVLALADAFPEATFVVVCRHPLAVVEGLRRKWALFADSSLEDACRFWADLHREFLEQSRALADRTVVVCYEQLVARPEDTHEKISSVARLKLRETPLRMGDRPDQRGFGLRNVVDGRIRLVGGATERAIQRLSEDEQAYIDDRLGGLYSDIVQRFCTGSETTVRGGKLRRGEDASPGEAPGLESQH